MHPRHLTGVVTVLVFATAPAIARAQIRSGLGTAPTASRLEMPDKWLLRSPAHAQKQQIGEYLVRAARLQFPGLYTVRQKAEQDPTVHAANDSLISDIEVRLTKADPAYANPKEDSLLHALQQAQQVGDSATFLQLARPIQKMEDTRRTAWMQVIQSPDVQQRVTAYRKLVLATMTAIDPVRMKWWRITQRLLNVQHHLSTVQQEAMQDLKVQAARDSVMTYVTAWLAKAASARGSSNEQTLMHEMQQARAAGDTAKFVQLRGQIQAIASTSRATLAQALSDPEMRNRERTFRAMLLAKMTDIDPNTPKLMMWLQMLQPTQPAPKGLALRMGQPIPQPPSSEVLRKAGQDPKVQAAVDSLLSHSPGA